MLTNFEQGHKKSLKKLLLLGHAGSLPWSRWDDNHKYLLITTLTTYRQWVPFSNELPAAVLGRMTRDNQTSGATANKNDKTCIKVSYPLVAYF